MTFNHKNNLKNIELCILRADYNANLPQCSPTPDLNNFVVDASSQFSPLKINPIENGAGIDSYSLKNKDKAIASDITLDFEASNPSLISDIVYTTLAGFSRLQSNIYYRFTLETSQALASWGNHGIYWPPTTPSVDDVIGFLHNSSTGTFAVEYPDNTGNYLTGPTRISSTSQRKNFIFRWNGMTWIDIGEEVMSFYSKQNLPHKYFRRYSFVLERGYKYHIEFYWAGTQITNQNTESITSTITDDLFGESKRLGVKMFSSNFSHYDIGLAGKSLNRKHAGTKDRILAQNSSKKYYNLIENAYTDTTIYIDYNVSNLLDYNLSPRTSNSLYNPYFRKSSKTAITHPSANDFDYGLQDILDFKKYSTINNLNKQSRLLIWRVKI